jgi:hypothetical protein
VEAVVAAEEEVEVVVAVEEVAEGGQRGDLLHYREKSWHRFLVCL